VANNERLRISLPIVVEGRYDKIKIASIAEAEILTTDGFSLFNDREKRALLRRMAKDGIIVLTDPDGGGKQIRTFLSALLGEGKVYHLHVPAVAGKEARKRTAGRAGLLGVEGADPDVLRALLAPFAGGAPARRASLTKADLFADGLSGGEGSAERRRALAVRLGLPPDLTPNALLAALNLLCTEEEYRAALSEVTV
jgi:ribonuclease M5